ncbi:MAG: glucose-6-phosphate dehydrogenase, partial [Burkholderiaceae bacterium]
MTYKVIFFGGTGDLAWRKLMPAMYEAFRHGALPGEGRILAAARERHDDASYRLWLAERFSQLSWAEPFCEQAFAQFAEQLHYLPMDLSDPQSYTQLR